MNRAVWAALFLTKSLGISPFSPLEELAGVLASMLSHDEVVLAHSRHTTFGPVQTLRDNALHLLAAFDLTPTMVLRLSLLRDTRYDDQFPASVGAP